MLLKIDERGGESLARPKTILDLQGHRSKLVSIMRKVDPQLTNQKWWTNHYQITKILDILKQNEQTLL